VEIALTVTENGRGKKEDYISSNVCIALRGRCPSVIRSYDVQDSPIRPSVPSFNYSRIGYPDSRYARHCH